MIMPGRAEAALEAVLLPEGGLQRVQRVGAGGHALDGGDGAPSAWTASTVHDFTAGRRGGRCRRRTGWCRSRRGCRSGPGPRGWPGRAAVSARRRAPVGAPLTVREMCSAMDRPPSTRVPRRATLPGPRGMVGRGVIRGASGSLGPTDRAGRREVRRWWHRGCRNQVRATDPVDRAARGQAAATSSRAAPRPSTMVSISPSVITNAGEMCRAWPRRTRVAIPWLAAPRRRPVPGSPGSARQALRGDRDGRGQADGPDLPDERQRASRRTAASSTGSRAATRATSPSRSRMSRLASAAAQAAACPEYV